MKDKDRNDVVFNPTLDRWQGKGKLKSAYKRAPKQEKETVARLKGRAIPASGSKFRKGDAEVPDVVRIECKATEADSFRVTKDMLRKIENAAVGSGQFAMIEIEFVDAKQNVLFSCCVMKRSAVTSLINRVTDAEGSAPTDRRSEQRAERHNGWRTPDKR